MRLSCLLAFVAFPLYASQPEVHYTLAMPEPASHYFHVTLDVTGWTGDTLPFAMPAWSPGRYVIYDFARNLKDVRVTADGRAVSAVKTDKQTWRVVTGGAHDLTISYSVYGNTLSGTFSQLDDEHANVNGASVFGYLVGHKDLRVGLTVRPYGNWRVVSGAVDTDGQTEFSFANYDLLIDTPMEISDLPVHRFTVEGKEYRVLIHTGGDTTNSAMLLSELERMVAAARRMMPPIDYQHYTFLFHFGLSGAGDGMEHLNSTQLITAQALSSPRGYEVGVNVASHEFFHSWNVKRLRPIELGPWDYSREDPTRSLWFAEGITNYYGDLVLRRAGIYGERLYIDQLQKAINIFLHSNGRFERSAEEDSWDTWFWRKPYGDEIDFDNTFTSYYTYGELLGYLLDIELRSRTDGRVSLDDVMGAMYEKFYWNAPAATYYVKGRGYTGADIIQVIDSVSGSSFDDFFRRYVSGKDPLPFASVLPKAGLALDSVMETDPYSGVSDPGGDGVIGNVDQGSPAMKAGIEKGDALIAVDDTAVDASNSGTILKGKKPGDTIKVTIVRRKRLLTIPVTLGGYRVARYLVNIDSSAPKKAEELRKGWIGETSR